MIVEATFPNADILLKPGMFATASIEQPQGRPAVVVPAVAVQPDPNTDAHRVYVIENGIAHLRIVQIGKAAAEGLATITSGLEPGEMVATSDLSELYDSAPVSAQAGA
jgi:membrane fusion protein (multidrug efflux system)